MPTRDETEPPAGSSDERELLLNWLGYLRASVLRKVEDLTEEQARWTPDGALISLIGIVNHLTHVEWRWIDGGMRGADVSRSEAEFTPGPELTLPDAVTAYRDRGTASDATVRSLPSLTEPCRFGDDTDLR